MNFKSITIAAIHLALFSYVYVVARAESPKGRSDVESTDALFKAGNFAEAGKLYTKIVAQDPRNYVATFQLGSIALLSNRLPEARNWFMQVQKLRPTDTAVNIPLAEVYCRRDEFQKAVPLLRAAGDAAKADMLASFRGTLPYEIKGPGSSTTVKFSMTDPLPLIQVRINGGEEANFFLDTGASDVVLDTEFARQLGVKQFGAEQGTFAGGQKGAVQRGKIGSIALGNWTIENVPVEIMNTRQYSQLFGGKQIDGIIGTALLYHFTSTLDYPSGQLVLRRSTSDNGMLKQASNSSDFTIVPFWLAGDHFIVALAKINNLEPVLVIVDTGSAGGGVKLTETMLDEAGIKLSEGHASEGVGGGGKLKSIPFTVKELSLGDATQHNVRGWYEGAFPWERSLGFRLGGMIGHEFLKPYAVTFDFDNMRILLERKSPKH